MSDGVQPGTLVDEQLWQQFRHAVEENKGGVRGHLRSELETALRLYINNDADVSAVQVNQRLARIESELGVAGTNGGTDALEAGEHTHAPSEPELDGKPAANASTDKKVAYLAECILDQEVPHEREFDEIARSVLVDTVKDEYGFRSDTAKRYVELLVDHFGLREHPKVDAILVTDERYAELVDAERERTKQQAESELEDLDQ